MNTETQQPLPTTPDDPAGSHYSFYRYLRWGLRYLRKVFQLVTRRMRKAWRQGRWIDAGALYLRIAIGFFSFLFFALTPFVILGALAMVVLPVGCGILVVGVVLGLIVHLVGWPAFAGYGFVKSLFRKRDITAASGN